MIIKRAEFYQNFILSIKLQDIQFKSDLKVKTSHMITNKGIVGQNIVERVFQRGERWFLLFLRFKASWVANAEGFLLD